MLAPKRFLKIWNTHFKTAKKWSFFRIPIMVAIALLGFNRLQTIVETNWPDYVSSSTAISATILVLMNLLMAASMPYAVQWLVWLKMPKEVRPGEIAKRGDAEDKVNWGQSLTNTVIGTICMLGVLSFELYLDSAYASSLADMIHAKEKEPDPSKVVAAYTGVIALREEAKKEYGEGSKLQKQAIKASMGVSTKREKDLHARQQFLWQHPEKAAPNEMARIDKELRGIAAAKNKEATGKQGLVDGETADVVKKTADEKTRIAGRLEGELDSLYKAGKVASATRAEKVTMGTWIIRGFIFTLFLMLFFAHYKWEYLMLTCDVKKPPSPMAEMAEIIGNWWMGIKYAMTEKLAVWLPERAHYDDIRQNQTLKKVSDAFMQKAANNPIYSNIFAYICTTNDCTESMVYRQFRSPEFSPMQLREILQDFLNVGALANQSGFWAEGPDVELWKGFFM